jgi:hypothetical protein
MPRRQGAGRAAIEVTAHARSANGSDYHHDFSPREVSSRCSGTRYGSPDARLPIVITRARLKTTPSDPEEEGRDRWGCFDIYGRLGMAK